MTTLEDLNVRVQVVMDAERSIVNRFFVAAKKHAIASRVGRVVVYVEDDPDQISLMKTLFAHYSKFRVEPAETVEAGKELISARPDKVRCVVLDICLGSDGTTDGMSLLRWLQSTYPSIPVIVLTAYPEYSRHVHEEFPNIDVYTKAAQTNEDIVKTVMRKTAAVA
jgi:DNA-binding NtrC family response regulator